MMVAPLFHTPTANCQKLFKKVDGVRFYRKKGGTFTRFSPRIRREFVCLYLPPRHKMGNKLCILFTTPLTNAKKRKNSPDPPLSALRSQNLWVDWWDSRQQQQQQPRRSLIKCIDFTSRTSLRRRRLRAVAGAGWLATVSKTRHQLRGVRRAECVEPVSLFSCWPPPSHRGKPFWR